MDFIKKILITFITLLACVSCNQKLEIAVQEGAEDTLPKENFYTYAILSKRAPITNDPKSLVFDSIGANVGKAFSAGAYTVKRDGYYNFSIVVNFPPYFGTGVSMNAHCKLFVYVNTVETTPVYATTSPWNRDNPCSVSANTTFQLRAGQVVYFKTAATIVGAPAEDTQTYAFGFLNIMELTQRVQ